jgi:hypothetical protein
MEQIMPTNGYVSNGTDKRRIKYKSRVEEIIHLTDTQAETKKGYASHWDTANESWGYMKETPDIGSRHKQNIYPVPDVILEHRNYRVDLGC